jgi:hypothetical protein
MADYDNVAKASWLAYDRSAPVGQLQAHMEALYKATVDPSERAKIGKYLSAERVSISWSTTTCPILDSHPSHNRCWRDARTNLLVTPPMRRHRRALRRAYDRFARRTGAPSAAFERAAAAPRSSISPLLRASPNDALRGYGCATWHAGRAAGWSSPAQSPTDGFGWWARETILGIPRVRNGAYIESAGRRELEPSLWPQRTVGGSAREVTSPWPA